MDPARIAELLQPFLPATPLNESQLSNISTYIDILIRWNARINLTAVRHPDEIVTRHFGESLFAASHLFPGRAGAPPSSPGAPPLSRSLRQGGDVAADSHPERLIDIGSGAGFPGLPIKLWEPEVHLTLIESNHKKATFLREVIRALTLTNVNVFAGRAQDFVPQPKTISTVTLRAVERFDEILPLAVRLAGSHGRISLLISQAQVPFAQTLAPNVLWGHPLPIPQSQTRVLMPGSITIVNNCSVI
jgi:16S rRNA (guanine527-N7)-methyltransferase